MTLKRLAVHIVAAVVIAAGMASCGTTRKAAAPHQGGGSASTSRQPAQLEHLDLSKSMARPTGALLREADSWIGTSYLYGGNDRSGVDCSGFVVKVFENALDIRLPRTSRQQQEFCTVIDRSELREGDLVFFTVRGGSTVGHVGIYVGNDRMIHASSSRGVIVSSLSSKYYIDNYYGAGRVEKYHAMLGGDRQVMPADPVAPAVVDAAPMASAVTKPQPAASGSQQPVKVIRFGGQQHVQVQPVAPVAPAVSDGGQPATPEADDASALEELSEFFD